MGLVLKIYINPIEDIEAQIKILFSHKKSIHLSMNIYSG